MCFLNIQICLKFPFYYMKTPPLSHYEIIAVTNLVGTISDSHAGRDEASCGAPCGGPTYRTASLTAGSREIFHEIADLQDWGLDAGFGLGLLQHTAHVRTHL